MKVTVNIMPSNSDSDLHAECIEMLKNGQTEFYEVRAGHTESHQLSKMACLHHNLGVSDPDDPEILKLELFINNFQMTSFVLRQFMLVFAEQGCIKFSGQNLLELQTSEPN
jgi:hypothetical protein